jgi:hypothetical protein
MDAVEHILTLIQHILWAAVVLRALKVAQGKNVVVKKKGLDVYVSDDEGPGNID